MTGFADLVARVVAEIDQPAALMAQSMGELSPCWRHSSGPNRSLIWYWPRLRAGWTWRAWARRTGAPCSPPKNRTVPQWFIEYHEDLTHRLAELRMPVLLLWGDADPISPVGVGQRLAVLLPRAELHVFPGAGHRLAKKTSPRRWHR
ncbi:alpha/beta fold hydrolase [Azotobacter vinelandii]